MQIYTFSPIIPTLAAQNMAGDTTFIPTRMPVHVLRPVGCPKKRPFFFAVRRKYPIFTKTMEKQPPCDAKAFSGEPFGHSSSATYSNSYTPCTTGRPTGQSISAGTSTFSMPGPPACYFPTLTMRHPTRVSLVQGLPTMA